MKSLAARGLVLVVVLLMPAWSHAQSMSALLGSAAVALDSAKVAQVKAGVAGTRFYYDTNSDGKMDECWFIDIDPMHPSGSRPLLVKVIDTSGNLAAGKEPSRASAVWIADWTADGSANSAIVYEDYDHDGDMDAMLEYFGNYWWWARDDGDDNLLWYDRNYFYSQNECQDHCHFGGDETFSAVEFNNTTKVFAPRWEAPFIFYDNNHDGRSDDVFRITVPSASQASTVLTLRWSFNVDGNGTGEDPRHYDCSISAYPVSGTTISGVNATSATLYGYQLTPILSRETARSWARSTTWLKGLFTWVENENNVGWATGGNYAVTSERWEGVIANGTTNFTPIGGPTVGPYNNRYELDTAPTGPFEFYFNPADKRIHMKRASGVWLETDWDSNYAGDMKYTWTDANSDGIVDHINFDIDKNGSIDDQWDIATNQIQNLSYDWQAFHDAIMPVLQNHPAQLYDLNQSLAAALEAVQAGSSTDAVWSLIENKWVNATLPEWKRVKFVGSDITLLYYLELVRDRRIQKLKTLATGSGYTAFWTSFNAARTTGDTAAMASLLRAQFGPATPNWTAFATWIGNIRTVTTKRTNSSTAWMPNGVAWETELAAWRVRNGQFDFFGKREKRLVLDGITASTDLSTDSGGWGMDSLNEGTGPGSGGLTLFVNGTAYPLYGTALTSATYRVVEQANDRVTVEMMINKAGPSAAPRTVRVLATALAGRADTQFQAVVEGGPATDTIELGVGLVRPTESYFENRPASGIVGIWGFQTAAIDWMGIGMIYPPSTYSRIIQNSGEIDLVLQAARGRLVNWTIQNDWRRGRRFTNFPTGPDWLTNLTASLASVTFPSPAPLVWVDFNYGGYEMGTETQPYQALDRGAFAVTAGGTVSVKAGTSGETVRIAKQMRVQASGGAATIGRLGAGFAPAPIMQEMGRNASEEWTLYD